MQFWRKPIKSTICNLVKTIISKNHIQKKKLSISLQTGAMLTKCSFDKKENRLAYYRGRDCIDKLCKKLKEHAMKTINYEKKKK